MLITKFVEVPNTNIKKKSLTTSVMTFAMIWHSNSVTLS